ncbi:hypothetical protein [Thermosyntropha sp.]|nr:hypothetical protein [Thermosyntropha sp.]
MKDKIGGKRHNKYLSSSRKAMSKSVVLNVSGKSMEDLWKEIEA